MPNYIKRDLDGGFPAILLGNGLVFFLSWILEKPFFSKESPESNLFSAAGAQKKRRRRSTNKVGRHQKRTSFHITMR